MLSTIPQTPTASSTHKIRRLRISPKPTINTGKWSDSRIKKLSVSAIAEPFTSSPDSSHSSDMFKEDLRVSSNDENQGDEGKFNWFSHWYPAAPEYDLDKRVPHAFTVMGLDIVVWWDKRNQTWQVFDDSCPHRRAPLSEGRIDEDGDLQCSYHGWCFGPKGDCKYIPQAPSDGPPVHTSKRACASTYPSLQQQGIVWFWPNTDPQFKDIAMDKKPPLIPVLSDPSFPCTLSMRDLPYGYEILTENLMDPSHVPYAHYGLGAQVKVTSEDKSHRRAGMPLDLCLESLDESGFRGKQVTGSSNFIPPCVYVFHQTFKTSKEGKPQPSISGTEQENMKAIFLIFICVPVSPGRSRLIWAFPTNFASWAYPLVPRWLTHIQQNLFLDSDSYFLHLEERKLQNYGKANWEKACYVPTSADAFVVAFRKWLKRYANNGVDWGKRFDVSLPPSPPKEQLMDRYWSHVVKCRSCKRALNVFRALEIVTQVISIASIGMLGVMATTKQAPSSSLYVWTTPLLCISLICCFASRWLSHFIYKTYYFHDYNHALVK